MPKTLDLEQMMKEQGYKGVDWQEFDNLVSKFDVKEPVEELIKQLTK